MTNVKKPLATDAVTFNKIDFSYQDIFNVVECFYSLIRNDKSSSAALSSIQDWPEHTERLTQFWWTRFGGKPYLFSEYTSMPKEILSSFNQETLSHWLILFHEALKEKVSDAQAHVWANVAVKMAQMLMAKNEFVRATQNEET